MTRDSRAGSRSANLQSGWQVLLGNPPGNTDMPGRRFPETEEAIARGLQLVTKIKKNMKNSLETGHLSRINIMLIIPILSL